MLEKIISIIQIFNSSLINNIKNLYIDKFFKKNRLVVYIYNNEKKNLMLMYSSKILEMS